MTREFTFVEYDFDRNGITEHAKANLSRERYRIRTEARLLWLYQRHPSSFICMQLEPKVSEAGSNEASTGRTVRHDAPQAKSQDTTIRNHLAVDFGSKTNRKTLPGGKKLKISLLENADIELSRKHDTTAVSSTPNLPLPASHDICASSRSQSANPCELRTLSDEMLTPSSVYFDHCDLSPPSLSAESWTTKLGGLSQQDLSLFRIFLHNAETMLGFDGHKSIVATYDPVHRLFLPFALGSEWCFETMVLLFTACFYQQTRLRNGHHMQSAGMRCIASRQNCALARTRSRISALAARPDSTDHDIVAFLFLAICEYYAGDKEIGTMRLRAWENYCKMMREQNIMPCALECKVIVWWCVSMLIDAEVDLDNVVSAATRAALKADPARIFRNLDTVT